MKIYDRYSVHTGDSVCERILEYRDRYIEKRDRLMDREGLHSLKDVCRLVYIPRYVLYIGHTYGMDIDDADGEYVYPYISKDTYEDICSICRCKYIDEYDVDSMCIEIDNDTDDDIVKIDGCSDHYYHIGCIKMMVKDTHIRCAVCTKIYGVLYGDMPDGTMDISYDEHTICDGYPDVGTIIIQYHFDSGIRNDTKYRGTNRLAFIPATKEGINICILLKIAFDRRLTFTIGTSLTTGMTNVVIWNSIHHKTSICGGTSSYGYPDGTYFNRVMNELAANGVYMSHITNDHISYIDSIIDMYRKPTIKYKAPKSTKRKNTGNYK